MERKEKGREINKCCRGCYNWGRYKTNCYYYWQDKNVCSQFKEDENAEPRTNGSVVEDAQFISGCQAYTGYCT